MYLLNMVIILCVLYNNVITAISYIRTYYVLTQPFSEYVPHLPRVTSGHTDNPPPSIDLGIFIVTVKTPGAHESHGLVVGTDSIVAYRSEVDRTVVE
jgi:hypothetical protein